MSNPQGVGAGGVLLAFIAGAAVGAVAALLYAPGPGETTREYLGQRAREGRNRAADAARQGREAFTRQRDNLISAVDRVRDQYRDSETPDGEQGA